MKLTPTGTLRARFAAALAPDTHARQRALTQIVGDFYLDPALVWLASDLASLQPGLDADDQLAASLLVLVSLMAQADGSTRYDTGFNHGVPSESYLHAALERLCAAVNERRATDLSCPALPGASALHMRMRELVTSHKLDLILGKSGTYKPLIHRDDFIYIEQTYRAEQTLIARLQELLTSAATTYDCAQVASAADDVATHVQFEISERQRDAMVASVHAPLVVISGGPGTGKTTLVLSILRLLTRLGLEPQQIAMAAPTGKAANRLWQSIQRSFNEIDASCGLTDDDMVLRSGLAEPSTVHRLLGYVHARDYFYFNARNLLSAEVVIIDESSMLDLSLMSALTSALKPTARLLLIGDADQLPSVSSGAVFRDLIPTEHLAHPGLAATRLTQGHRFGAQNPIGILATAINAGDASATIAALTPRPTLSTLSYDGVEAIDSADIEKFLDHWFKRHLSLDNATVNALKSLKGFLLNADASSFVVDDADQVAEIFERHDRARILCFTHHKRTGTEHINASLAKRHRSDDQIGQRPMNFHVGEPVMMLRNDYVNAIFNGDQGVILNVRLPDTGRLQKSAVFPGTEAGHYHIIDLERIQHALELSYAITTHKSQGSEYPHIALVLPNDDMQLLTRELLYTGITRASKSVTVYGNTALLALGATRKIVRSTGIREGVL
ncbi:MAG: exodeoxyribonuclease V subunit alpha [Bradymonadaceae bacterium]|nr:exodeoxyribonuclease V subunit alpha [Lujinxingiaceae bacterium]